MSANIRPGRAFVDQHFTWNARALWLPGRQGHRDLEAAAASRPQGPQDCRGIKIARTSRSQRLCGHTDLKAAEILTAPRS